MNQDKTPSDEFRFARGWFIVAASGDVTSEAPLRLFFFDRKMVAFRNPDGRVSVLDAVCPHMGAEFGVQGLVEDGGIRCPYHHWRFGPDGRCNHIPYSSAIPPQAKVHSYPVREESGCVLVWHDPEFGEPDFDVPSLEEFTNPIWVPWTVIRRDIHSVPMEVIDNIADSGHFLPVHQTAPLSFAIRFEGISAIQRLEMTHETMADAPGETVEARSTYYGPGFFLTRLSGRYRSIMLLSVTPIDDENIAIWFGLMVESEGEVTPEFLKIRDEYVEHGLVSATQDIDIWEAKSVALNPMLCRDDGPILRAREWYRQFLVPRAKQRQEQAA